MSSAIFLSGILFSRRNTEAHIIWLNVTRCQALYRVSDAAQSFNLTISFLSVIVRPYIIPVLTNNTDRGYRPLPYE